MVTDDALSETLRLLTNAPRRVPATRAQLDAIAVLADQHAGHPLASLIALRLQGQVIDEARLSALGLEPWRRMVDARSDALDLLPLERLVSGIHDAQLGFRVLSWTGTAPATTPLHAPVAAWLRELLGAVERRELSVAKGEPEGYRLSNGWRLDVFVRGYWFWRIDNIIDPDGFELELIAFDDGPLAELNEYEPPEDVEREVYGLGTR